MANTGKLDFVNFIIDHESLEFVGYEFEVKEEVLIEESDCEQWLFRCDIDKKTGEATVYAAYSQDFDIMEEATDYFDTEQLVADIKAYIERKKGTDNEVDNQGSAFVRYCQLCEEGYDCDSAIMKCYEENE